MIGGYPAKNFSNCLINEHKLLKFPEENTRKTKWVINGLEIK